MATPAHRGRVEMPVRWSDVDLFGHVNNAAYLRYLKRHGQSGDEFNDWVEAERELRGRNGHA